MLCSVSVAPRGPSCLERVQADDKFLWTKQTSQGAIYRRPMLEKMPAGMDAEAVSLWGRGRGEASREPLADDGEEMDVKAEHIEPMETSERHDIMRRSLSLSSM